MTRWRRVLVLGLAALALGVAYDLWREIRPSERQTAAVRARSRGVRVRPAILDRAVAARPPGPTGPGSSARPHGAFDFRGPEFEGPAERPLSAEVAPQQRAAVEEAWRSGRYEEAARLAASFASHDDRRQVLRPLLSEWARQAPESAADFAWALAPGVERREFLETVVREWAARDLVTASQWLNARPASGDVDPAVAVVATSEVLTQFQPETALSWAESIGAPALRADAMGTVLITWARRDEPAALDHLNRSVALDPEARRRLALQVRQLSAPAD